MHCTNLYNVLDGVSAAFKQHNCYVMPADGCRFHDSIEWTDYSRSEKKFPKLHLAFTLEFVIGPERKGGIRPAQSLTKY